MSEIENVSGGPTKPEIIAVSLSKLGLREGDRFADIGCGTGSVSIEATKIARDLIIYAIDARKEALRATETNFKNFNIANATLLAGEAESYRNQLQELQYRKCHAISWRSFGDPELE